jgi:hypothetical protein
VELADQEAEDADEFGAFGEEDSVRGEEGMLVDESLTALALNGKSDAVFALLAYNGIEPLPKPHPHPIQTAVSSGRSAKRTALEGRRVCW